MRNTRNLAGPLVLRDVKPTKMSLFATLKAGGWVHAARTLWLLHEEVPAKSASTALSCQFQVEQRWSNHFNKVVNCSIKGKRERRQENVGCVSDDFKNPNSCEHMSAICLHWHSIGYLMSAWIYTLQVVLSNWGQLTEKCTTKKNAVHK